MDPADGNRRTLYFAADAVKYRPTTENARRDAEAVPRVGSVDDSQEGSSIMPSQYPSERRIAGSLGAHISWANTTDRTARTEPGRRALDAKFLAQADGDLKRAASLRKAYFTQLALKSAQARRKARQERDDSYLGRFAVLPDHNGGAR